MPFYVVDTNNQTSQGPVGDEGPQVPSGPVTPVNGVLFGNIAYNDGPSQSEPSPTVWDISNMVQRDTVRMHSTLSVDIDSKGGESTLSFVLTDYSRARFKPLVGKLIFWVGDDDFNLTYFGGVITKAVQIQAGQDDNFDGASRAVLSYHVTCRDASWLMEKKLTEAGTFNQTQRDTGESSSEYKPKIRSKEYTFPNYIGNNPGDFLDLLAVASDPRISFADNNDEAGSAAFLLPQDYELGRMTYKDAIDQVAQEAGLLWWIDAHWVFHHKAFSTIYNTLADSYFGIVDGGLNYYNFEIREDTEKWVSRVKVYGSVYDAGDVNSENQKKGRQKREEIQVVVTAGIDIINAIRARLGFAPLPDGTDPETLDDTCPGIWIGHIEAPNVYHRTKDGDPDPQSPNYELLKQIGETYLLRYGQPDLVGSVCYNDRPPVVGQSIQIESNERDVHVVLPIVEVEVDSSGPHTGNDEFGYRRYAFKAQFRGPSNMLRFAHMLAVKRIKGRDQRLLKPKPPIVVGTSLYTEISGEPSGSGTQPVVQTSVSAKIVFPDNSIQGAPIVDTNPTNAYIYPEQDQPDSASPPPVVGDAARLPLKYFPPIRQPWNITSGFGLRTPPLGGASHFHAGVDIGCKTGTPLRSVWNGKVIAANQDPKANLGGKYIKVAHDDGTVASYLHLNDIKVKVGQQVLRGELLGYTGNTGNSTGPHLHFGLKQSNNPVDPMTFKYFDEGLA